MLKREIVQCPANCASASEAKVFGNAIYSPPSSICRAAIHAGSNRIVRLETGGFYEELRETHTYSCAENKIEKECVYLFKLHFIYIGVLTDSGGQVELQVESERNFEGSEQNGIASQPADFYLRSFSFSHTSEVACFPFSLPSVRKATPQLSAFLLLCSFFVDLLDRWPQLKDTERFLEATES